MTAIIILNWNGAADTISCLESLKKAEGDFFVVVADNGSRDDSLQLLRKWISDNADLNYIIQVRELGENYGFAKGNNLAIESVRDLCPDYYLLLNNDTVVTPDFLTRLVGFRSLHPEYRVLVPKINYYGERTRVWNCGGRIRAGFLSYYYAGAMDGDIRVEQNYLNVQFVSGCALFCSADVLDSEGKLFTERFFFGEEDFDFSLRMMEEGISAACVLDSLIYHKVGRSRGTPSAGKVYSAYLSRFINVRVHYGKVRFHFWKMLYFPRCVRVFQRTGIGFRRSLRLVLRLYADSNRKKCVSRDDYMSIVDGTYFMLRQ